MLNQIGNILKETLSGLSLWVKKYGYPFSYNVKTPIKSHSHIWKLVFSYFDYVLEHSVCLACV